MPKLSKIITIVVAGFGVLLLVGIIGSVIVFNTFIKPNAAVITQPLADISTPILEGGEQAVQEGIEQGTQESQNIISEIIDANITAVREQIISTFTIGGGEGESEGGE